MQKNKVVVAENLGRAAFASGKPRMVVLDADCMAMVKGLQIGEGAPVMMAWLRGWDKANVSNIMATC